MRVYLESIGCRLNQSEMERLARQLAGLGHQLVGSAAWADACVLNTCAVTAEAERKSRQAARRLARLAGDSNPAVRLILTGCQVSLNPDPAGWVANVPAYVAEPCLVENPAKDDIVTVLDPGFDRLAEPRWLLPGGRTRALVKIQDGCDNRCSYCVTRIARGPGQSRPLPSVTVEIQALVAAGYQEVVLTGVNLGSYGRGSLDQSGASTGPDLRGLIEAILSQTALPRLRLSSIEPWGIPAGFFELWQDPRLCRQLHLPLQSGSPNVLRRMRRPITPAGYRWLAETAVAAIPGLALTTDVIAGFPGETEAELQQTIELVRELPLARLHVFGYSRRPGTPAADMEHQLDPSLISERSRQVRELAREKQRAFSASCLGQTLDVLWESGTGTGPDGIQWRGHTDNYVQVTTASPHDLRNTITPTHLVRLDDQGVRGIVGAAP